MNVTAFDVAHRFVGMGEVAGAVDNPAILAMLRLDQKWPDHDEVPWCSAFVNTICWLLGLPRSKSLRARSWLSIGKPIDLSIAVAAFDIVILKQNPNDPGPEVLDAVGHVGFYFTHGASLVSILGGNQANNVNIANYQTARILGIRRLRDWIE